MNEAVVWWIGIQLVGCAAFPLTFAFFRGLADRGYAFAKIIGLLLLGYGLWMGAILGLWTNGRGAVFLVLIAIACASLFVTASRRQDLRDYLRLSWPYIVFVEAMFVTVFAAAVFLRSFVPEINSGEKPFELAFLNAINRTENFPPPDPWLSGENISYYYFGYVQIAALTKLVALETKETFFLGLSVIASLTWVAAFGLVYNLIRAGSARAVAPVLALRPVLFALAAPLLMLIVGNLDGAAEHLARHGVGSAGFYDFLGIHTLDGPYDCGSTSDACAEWYPTRREPFDWWWWATRMGSSFDIQEFPFFSLHFGDLHAHVMVMPLLITIFAACYQMVARALAAPSESLFRPARLCFFALLAGGALFTDSGPLRSCWRWWPPRF